MGDPYYEPVHDIVVHDGRLLTNNLCIFEK